MNDSNLDPPHWPNRLLRWFCSPVLIEEIEGDLQELYLQWVLKYGEKKARRIYLWHALKFLRPYAINYKLLNRYKTNSPMMMFKHNMTIAWRNMLRNKSYSLINMAGLALGMTCFLFLKLWVQDEKDIDNFHKNGKYLYNIYETVYNGDHISGVYNTPVFYSGDRRYVSLEDIRETVPEVEDITYYATGYELPWGHPETFQVGDNIQKLEGSRAGEDFFKMFSYPVIAGNPATALSDLSSIAISRKMAGMFFKSPEDAIGKSIRYENRLDFTVTAVFEKISHQSSLKFDFLINWKSQMGGRLEWSSNFFQTTLRLSKGADVRTVENKINRFYESTADKNSPEKIVLGLQPFRDKYLVSNFVNGKPQGGKIEYVRIFSWVSLFILVIACVNFMDLATARSVKRSKEVGVRKVIGSTRGILIRQFLGESMLMSGFAFIMSLILLWLLLPYFNLFTGKSILLPLSSRGFWYTLAGMVLVTGVVAGSYPALFLSSLKPVRILKGSLRFSSNNILFRKSLSVFQFSLSILLLIATLVVSRQIDFIRHTHLGYDRDNLLYVRIEGELQAQKNYLAFKNEAERLPEVSLVDRSSEAPHSMDFLVDADNGVSETVNGSDAINWEGKLKDEHVAFEPASVGYDFVKIMGLKIAEGRDFSRDMVSDSADAFLVNEEAVKQMGMKDPIGKWISAWNKKGHIIGILKDYHTNSLHDPIRPVVLDVKEYEYFGVIMVRTEPGKVREALAGLTKVYKQINPNYPFVYQFVDQEYDRMYRSETVISRISGAFTSLTIIISCLGLLGLAMFAAEQRVKEIGIRKVLGASVKNIITLFSGEFVQLIGLSFLIAAPVGWIIMHRWLQDYAYRINLTVWIFILAGFAGMVVAMFTISVQAVRAAMANPVDNLRSE